MSGTARIERCLHAAGIGVYDEKSIRSPSPIDPTRQCDRRPATTIHR